MFQGLIWQVTELGFKNLTHYFNPQGVLRPDANKVKLVRFWSEWNSSFILRVYVSPSH